MLKIGLYLECDKSSVIDLKAIILWGYACLCLNFVNFDLYCLLIFLIKIVFQCRWWEIRFCCNIFNSREWGRGCRSSFADYTKQWCCISKRKACEACQRTPMIFPPTILVSFVDLSIMFFLACGLKCIREYVRALQGPVMMLLTSFLF